MLHTSALLRTLASALLPCSLLFAQSTSHHRSTTKTESFRPLSNQEKAQHILERFTFGPRPGEVAAVTKQGWDAWFEQQLNPDTIPDTELDKRLDAYPALKMSPSEIAASFPDAQALRQIEMGKRAMPQDPVLTGAFEVALAKYDEQQAKKNDNQAPPPIDLPQQSQQNKQEQLASAQMLASQVLGYPKNMRMQAIMKLPVEQRIVLCRNIAEPQRSLLLNDFTPREREIFYMMAGGGGGGLGVVQNEMMQAKVLRAILSERQLQEVMTDFWFNHFNVFMHKNGFETYYLPDYERNVIRAHALGKFKDLLLATAEHPAMLDYLDNWTSIGPDSAAAEKSRPGKKQADRGLNENYGREVMELHTVSVNGGYTQTDVTNLAKIFTGWTIDHPQLGGPFVFDERRHEPGPKKWFGHTVKEDGFNEGVQALMWLAAQPQTAHFISYKLAQRFVADDPPPTLVDRMARTFLSSDGDIREVLRTMVHSPEFWSRTNYRNKVKTPLEFVASAFRATDTNPTNPGALVTVIARMGEPLYQMQPPTGYPMTADHWMNSAALVDRLNFSMALADNRLGGMKFDAPHLLAEGMLTAPAISSESAHTESVSLTATPPPANGQDEALSLMEQLLVAGDVSSKTTAVIKQQLAQTQVKDPIQLLDTMTALILGSPEFQMR
ncbi:DUF1800 domain-containing protein [Pseudacidobacterium ailaaui]|jgi:uncharacterized protein (DUF1800 family)|uniref:DUF1800 domain-containing protein n=1 Tax=Pseudacidobacterium ailaaui TaxID=1382359 RepID=UPI000A64D432|nr:DUF1800 domain-containing protein [Pseudacidobacterium ailaaui]